MVRCTGAGREHLEGDNPGGSTASSAPRVRRGAGGGWGGGVLACVDTLAACLPSARMPQHPSRKRPRLAEPALGRRWCLRAPARTWACAPRAPPWPWRSCTSRRGTRQWRTRLPCPARFRHCRWGGKGEGRRAAPAHAPPGTARAALVRTVCGANSLVTGDPARPAAAARAGPRARDVGGHRGQHGLGGGADGAHLPGEAHCACSCAAAQPPPRAAAHPPAAACTRLPACPCRPRAPWRPSWTAWPRAAPPRPPAARGRGGAAPACGRPRGRGAARPRATRPRSRTRTWRRWRAAAWPWGCATRGQGAWGKPGQPLGLQRAPPCALCGRHCPCWVCLVGPGGSTLMAPCCQTNLLQVRRCPRHAAPLRGAAAGGQEARA